MGLAVLGVVGPRMLGVYDESFRRGSPDQGDDRSPGVLEGRFGSRDFCVHLLFARVLRGRERDVLINAGAGVGTSEGPSGERSLGSGRTLRQCGLRSTRAPDQEFRPRSLSEGVISADGVPGATGVVLPVPCHVGSGLWGSPGRFLSQSPLPR